MSDDQKTVFVLGAGFTRAFLPDAPLMVDDYDGPSLMQQFDAFPRVKELIQLELDINDNEMIDIERLMTRLDGKMPYDVEHRTTHLFDELLSVIKRRFREKLDDAKKGNSPYKSNLRSLGQYCLEQMINCITFNSIHRIFSACYGCRYHIPVPRNTLAEASASDSCSELCRRGR